VAIQKEGDPLGAPVRTGAAHVPAVPAVRSLVGYDWLPFTEARRWVAAIGAAALLAQDSGLPARSALYQVLASDPAERIARRIEESGGGRLTGRHLHLIEQLPGFRSRRKEALL
jgi:nucleotide-binding universal stress UspA family protein